jgi:hypothetical protein
MHKRIAATLISTSLLALAGYAPEAPAQAEREELERERRAVQERAAREAEREAQVTERQAVQQAEREAREAEREKQQAERQAQQAEREALKDNLAVAREELERAAQEVARLSRQFAAPYADGMFRQFESFGRRAMLGLSPEDTELGVRVAGVSPGGPAAEAGIQIGDVIVEIDGAALADPRGRDREGQSPTELLLAQMGNVEPGESVELTVRRDGDDREVTLEADESNPFAYAFGNGSRALPAMPALAQWPMLFGGNPWQQMQLVTLTPELGSYFGTDKGILVVRGPESDAHGLQDGDVILDIGGRVPATPEHAIRILGSFEEGETLNINVMRRQRRETLQFAMPAR